MTISMFFIDKTYDFRLLKNDGTQNINKMNNKHQVKSHDEVRRPKTRKAKWAKNFKKEKYRVTSISFL